MKVQELQYGDWFATRFKDEWHYNQYTEEHLALLKMDKDAYDHFYPVELTPEILEKNGFHFGFTSNEEDMAACTTAQLNPNDKGWVWDEGDGAIKVIFPNESDGGEVKLEGTNYLACMFDEIYVHQLQQLIRLSGIDKEITLTDF